MRRFPIQKYKKPICKKQRKRSDYLTRNSISLKFVKRTVMPDPRKNFSMSNARSRMATDILKALTIASATTGDRFVVKQEVSSQIGN